MQTLWDTNAKCVQNLINSYPFYCQVQGIVISYVDHCSCLLNILLLSLPYFHLFSIQHVQQPWKIDQVVSFLCSIRVEAHAVIVGYKQVSQMFQCFPFQVLDLIIHYLHLDLSSLGTCFLCDSSSSWHMVCHYVLCCLLCLYCSFLQVYIPDSVINFSFVFKYHSLDRAFLGHLFKNIKPSSVFPLLLRGFCSSIILTAISQEIMLYLFYLFFLFPQ